MRMPRTIAELEADRDTLLKALASDVNYVRDSNGEAVGYRTPQEINQALQAIESELAAARKPQNPIRPTINRGL